MTNRDQSCRGRAVPTILDVDTGVDDALALMLACAAEEIDLVGVTCVAGNTRLPDVLTNTRAILRYCGREYLPVAAGADRALVREPVGLDNAWVHGGAGRGYATIAERLAPSTNVHAAQFIVDEVRRRPGEITLISTGPMTNIALALRLEPRLPSLIGRWIFMGGAFAVGGNTTPAAEFNVQADPEAARIAISEFSSAPQRPTAIGLDVTHQVRLLPRHIERLAAMAGDEFSVVPGSGPWGTPSNPLLAYLEGAIRKYAEYHQQLHGFYGTYLHDPVTVAVAMDPTLVSVRPAAVDVECRGALTAGATVADWKKVWDKEPNVDVAITVDAERALATVTHAVGSFIASAESVRDRSTAT
ncbi:nucleoside hydrolase [Kribbella turkmenica]|uniref:Nucleoside hydrolase n=1 Tax=Kribbella turkmenica TaxID=2530375 RepID=A0A4R4XBK9_9ACTN|nr:nucleoside hydrolase [Kribbella turkmenica]TDD28051.1 nucleoside hydrolase [Kribbella turkmenica]